MNSPRSTRGTTRRSAYSKRFIAWFPPVHSPTLSALADGYSGRLRKRSAPLRHSRSLTPQRARLGDHAYDGAKHLWSEPRGERRVGFGDRAGEREQNVVPDGGEGASACGLQGLPVSCWPVVVEVQRSPVVYEPETIVPDQEVRVAQGAVDVGHQGVEPDDARCQAGIRRLYERVEAKRAWQVVQRQVQAGAPFQEVLYLGVGFRAAQLGGEAGEHDLRHEEIEAAGDLTGYQLRHQCLAALSSPTELEDVGPEIVRLDDRRQGTPLTQRRYVPRRSDRP